MSLRSPFVRLATWLAALLLSIGLTGCGYNDFQRLDEQTQSAWSEVLNQYQRRADLIPNIVATVKGEANFEQETLTRVIEARAKATSIQVTPETLNDPAAMQQFQILRIIKLPDPAYSGAPACWTDTGIIVAHTE